MSYSNEQEHKLLYEYYVTDALKAMTFNVSGFTKESNIMKERYYDLLKRQNSGAREQTEEAKQSGSEIAGNVIGSISRARK